MIEFCIIFRENSRNEGCRRLFEKTVFDRQLFEYQSDSILAQRGTKINNKNESLNFDENDEIRCANGRLRTLNDDRRPLVISRAITTPLKKTSTKKKMPSNWPTILLEL